MKKIYRKICLEDFKSRMPLLLKSLYSNGATIVFDSKDKLLQYTMGNYSMFPYNLIITKDEEHFTTLDESLLTKMQDENKYEITYHMLKKMYHFFMFYKRFIVTNPCEGEKSSSSATEYMEIYDKISEEGYDYEDIDKTYSRYGGNEMSDLLLNGIFAVFHIDAEYQRYWRIDRLYAIDAFKWQIWFDKMHEKYWSGCTVQKETVNCVEKDIVDKDCEEYESRGGNYMYDKLTEFVERVFKNYEYNDKTSINLPLMLTSSIDDIGVMTNGFQYYNPYEVYSKGDIVNYDMNMYFRNDSSESTYIKENDILKFNEKAWTAILPTVVTPYYKYYSYRYDGAKIYFKDNSEVSRKETKLLMGEHVTTTISTNGGAFYDGYFHAVEIREYVLFDEEYAFLGYDRHGKYVTFKNSKYYASCDGKHINIENYKPNMSYQFNIEIGEFISIDTDALKVDTTKEIVQYGANILPIVDGYCTINNETVLLKGKKLFTQSSYYKDRIHTYTLTKYMEDDEYVILDNSNEVVLYRDYTIYNSEIISGTTDSKLSIFKLPNTFVDNLNNSIDAIYEISSGKPIDPIENTVLDIPFKNRTTISLDVMSEDTNLFWGNILYEMEFYYTDREHNVISEKVSASTVGNDNLAAIKALDNSKPSGNTYVELHCDFTYYIGAILTANTETSEDGTSVIKYDFADKNKKSSHGIEYKEIKTLTKEKVEYFMGNNASYYIYYYKIEPCNFTDTNIDLSKTFFNVYIKHNNDISGYSANNLIINAPLFRNDYNIGKSAQNQVKDYVAVDRGLIKPHESLFRILDTKSLSALEKYGNGTIKILNS